jgi:hypothetical protein
MKKIKIISIVAVAMAVTISVGFTSCSKNRDIEVEVDKSKLIREKWYNTIQGYRIEFRKDSTYSYEHSKFGNGEGNYRIYETIEDQELWFSDDETFNTTMFKILVNGSTVFNEIWVYHYIYFSTPNIAVDFYLNNEILPDDFKVYIIEPNW